VRTVRPIRLWMNLGYIAHSYNVPPLGVGSRPFQPLFPIQNISCI
jgi:hypothetical protein